MTALIGLKIVWLSYYCHRWLLEDRRWWYLFNTKV